MGRYVISLCAAALLIGFVLLLSSMGVDLLHAPQNAAGGVPVQSAESLTLPAPGDDDTQDRPPATAPLSRAPDLDAGMFGAPPRTNDNAPWSPDGLAPDSGPGAAGMAALAGHSQPAYPEACRAGAGPVEQVSVSFTIGAGGAVSDLKMLASSNDCFNGPVLQWVKQRRFPPAAEARTMRQTFVFRHAR